MTTITATTTLSLSLILGALTLSVLNSTEPAYHDKKLSAWLADLDTLDPSKHQQATQAVRAMGTNALPVLVKRLRAKDSALKRALLDFCEDHPMVPLQLASAEERYDSALQACRILGPLAVPALPHIMNFLEGTRSAGAVKVLAAIGPESIQPLKAALASDNEGARLGAAVALGTIAGNPEEIVPLLILRLNETNCEIRMTAAWALGRFGGQARAALPKLSALTNDPADNVRKQAALASVKITRGSHPIMSAAE